MKTLLKSTAAVFLFLSCAESNVASQAPTADFLIQNANVITVNSNQAIAEAIAVRDEKIIFVGKNSEAQKWIGGNTHVIDAKGKTVMPGIYDSHVHSYRASVSELGGGAPFIRSIAEAQKWIRDQAAKKLPGSWIVLERVYATRVKEGRLPTKAELDEAAPNNRRYR